MLQGGLWGSPSCCRILESSAKPPMATLTATNCFSDAEFKAYWESVYDETFKVDDCIIPDDGWMLEFILSAYEKENPAFYTAEELIAAFRDDDCFDYSVNY